MSTFFKKRRSIKLKTLMMDFIYDLTVCLLIGLNIIVAMDTIQSFKENQIELKSLFPLTISNKVGKAMLYEREIDKRITTIEEEPFHPIAPSDDFLKDPFLTDLTSEMTTDDSELLQEKQEIIHSFFKIEEPTNHKVDPSIYKELMMKLPLELLTRMKEDHLVFTLSEEPPFQIEKGVAIATYYRKKNEIVFWNTHDTQTSLFHEIGHWFEHYLYKKVDHYRLDRISEAMINELQYLGFDSYYYDYITTDHFETFAALFEQFFTQYPTLYQNAPISHDYILYYLKKVLT